MSHAGPSITITSITDGIAFFIGSTSRVKVLKSFCMFCGCTVVMLYLCVITVFLCIVVWDTRRTTSKNKECFGLCCCKEDSAIFFKGRFLTPIQKKFSLLEEKRPKNTTYIKSENKSIKNSTLKSMRTTSYAKSSRSN